MRKIFLSLSIIGAITALSGCSEEKIENTKKETVSVSDLDNLVIKNSKYIPNTHYKVIEKPIDAKENEIIEYFWYRCGHCYTFENTLKHNYMKLIENKITMRTEHAALSNRWVPDAQLFYALKKLNLDKKATPLLMEFFHNNKDKKITMEGILEKLGVSEDVLDKTMTSEEVINDLKKSHEQAIQAGIKGTPSLIVEGKYLMINKAFKSQEDLLDAAIELTRLNDKEDEKK